MPDEYNTWPSFWSHDLELEFGQYAQQVYPEEAVAVIVEDKLMPLPNISDTPLESFEVNIPTDIEDSLQGIIHSHPNGHIKPSKQDYITYLSLGIPSGIVTCTEDSCSKSYWLSNLLLSTPLENRPFIHAYYDCYSLIRSYYKQVMDISLKDYPREDEWWINGEDMYDQLFSDAGFAIISSQAPLEIGDIVFMSIHSNVVNHAAIYLGDDNILHHLHGRLSRVDKLSAWGKMIDKVVRYND